MMKGQNMVRGTDVKRAQQKEKEKKPLNVATSSKRRVCRSHRLALILYDGKNLWVGNIQGECHAKRVGDK
jgi:hypothetical protein